MAVEFKQANYFIPIPDTTLTTPTGTVFVQTLEIPVAIREETWPCHTFYAYFCLPPVELVAGGEDKEIASQRIRTQMIHHLEMYSEAIKNPNPPLNARSGLEVIGKYFYLKT